ncbi:MAG: hypothetical protein ABI852_11465 [Gemmatimonadaceae bacterium]
MKARSLVALALVASQFAPLFTLGAQTQTVPKLNLSKPDWVAAEPFSIEPELRVLSSGMIIAADFNEMKVRLISATGKTVRQIGREGSGPSEYTAPQTLIALPHDSTLLLDRDERRILTIDPQGKIVSTRTIPNSLDASAERLAAADNQGRVYFPFERAMVKKGDPHPSSYAIARWRRNTETFDTVAVLSQEVPKYVKGRVPKTEDYKKFTELGAWRITMFAPVDNWVVAPSGRVAIIYAAPYHVEWIETNKSRTIGANVSYVPVAVTDKDRKHREPKGPPYVRVYAKTKAAFEPETALLDEADNVWVRRNDVFGSANRRWDVFNSRGGFLTTLSLPDNLRPKVITARYAYVLRTDDDGLSWLERYSR